jgi:hypothetical protein
MAVNVFVFELSQIEKRMQSRHRRVANTPVEDDYSEDSFPDEDGDGDLAWRQQQMLVAAQLRMEADTRAKCPHRDVECAVLSV